MKEVDMPGDIEKPIRFFGIFTLRDLVGIGLLLLVPGGLAHSTTDLIHTAATVSVAGIVATGWYLYRPGNKTLEQHLYHRLRWTVKRWFL